MKRQRLENGGKSKPVTNSPVRASGVIPRVNTHPLSIPLVKKPVIKATNTPPARAAPVPAKAAAAGPRRASETKIQEGVKRGDKVAITLYIGDKEKVTYSNQPVKSLADCIALKSNSLDSPENDSKDDYDDDTEYRREMLELFNVENETKLYEQKILSAASSVLKIQSRVEFNLFDAKDYHFQDMQLSIQDNKGRDVVAKTPVHGWEYAILVEEKEEIANLRYEFDGKTKGYILFIHDTDDKGGGSRASTHLFIIWN